MRLPAIRTIHFIGEAFPLPAMRTAQRAYSASAGAPRRIDGRSSRGCGCRRLGWRLWRALWVNLERLVMAVSGRGCVKTGLGLGSGGLHSRDGLVRRAIKAWTGTTHFLTKTLPKVRTEMSLHVLAYNLKRATKICGTRTLIQAIRA